jgi:putative permease
MIEKLNNFFKKIFINDETIVFSLMLIATLVVLNYFGSILTPFLVSIIVAYLLVGLQRKLESFGLRSLWALIATFTIFIIVGAALLIWLLPILYSQLQLLVLETPGLLNDFFAFISQLQSSYPDLVSSDQISAFFQSVSSEITQIAQNIVKSSISGIQSAITVLIYILLFPILVYFFLFDRSQILNGFLKIIPGERKMLYTNLGRNGCAIKQLC